MRKGLEETIGGQLLVPADKARRQTLEQAVARYVAGERLLPPLTAEELAAHAQCAASGALASPDEWAYLSLLLNNALWADVVASIPYERRLLLLPQCLSDGEHCRAERDSIGLLCAQCGACAIGEIQTEADRLGYVMLVAEGTTVVSKLLSSGKVDAVIGVGCLDSLRRIFPIMTAHAIPGQGIPLLTDGCARTSLDSDWAIGVIRARKNAMPLEGADLDVVATVVRQWFAPNHLQELIGKGDTEAQRLALDWMLTGGKRWRPILTAAIFNAADGGDINKIRSAAVAVECFHKASLIHDDIEDNDQERYGEPTLHRRVGVPAAINAGDYLIGEGYRLLAGSDLPVNARAELALIAACGHRELCMGQGEELAFCRTPAPVTEATALRIYEQKTAVAFEVAVLTGAVAAGIDAAGRERLSAFSRAIGTAYQIRDDIEDFRSAPGRAADLLAMRPTLFLAVACASEHPAVAQALQEIWSGDAQARHRLIDAIAAAGLHARVELLYAHYRHETERALSGIQHTGLTRLLRRVMARILA